MKKYRLLLCLLLIFILIPFAAAQEDDPIVVSVGDVSFRLQEVQAYLNNYITRYEEQVAPLSLEEKQTICDSVVDSFVARGIMSLKGQELDLTILTPQQEATLKTNTKAAYDQLVEDYATQLADAYQSNAATARTAAAAMLEVQGTTYDSLYAEALMQWQDQRMLEYVGGDVPSPTQEEIEAAYQQYYVTPTRNAYAYDIPTYESNAALYEQPTYFIPEGYRVVRQIVLPLSEGLSLRMNDAVKAMDAALTTLLDAMEKLEQAMSASADTTETQRAYDTAALIYGEKENVYSALKNAALLETDSTTSTIRRALESGETFEALALQYSTAEKSTGAVHRESILYSSEYIEAAFALENHGDVSPAFADAMGVYLLYYEEDLQSGPVPMSQAIAEEIEAQLIVEKRYEKLQVQLSLWEKEYSIVKNSSLLTLPQ